MSSKTYIKEFFVCPNCDKILCERSKLQNFNDKYCTNCGTRIAEMKEELLAI